MLMDSSYPRCLIHSNENPCSRLSSCCSTGCRPSRIDRLHNVRRDLRHFPAGPGGVTPRLRIGRGSPICGGEHYSVVDRRSRMKNPFMSLWLSNANRALGAGRGIVTAEMRRQQSAAAKEAMRAAGLGGAVKPKKKRPAKRKAK
jgi:hypothetical protein